MVLVEERLLAGCYGVVISICNRKVASLRDSVHGVFTYVTICKFGN